MIVNLGLFKEYLQIDSDKTSGDGFLTICLEDSIAKVENYCNRQFEKGTYVQYSNGDNSQEIFLRNYPVTDVQSIEWFDGFSHWTNILTGSDTTANSFYIIPETNQVRMIKYWLPKGYKNIRTTYIAGFENGECVADIRGVILEMASLVYFNSPQSGKARLGISSENTSSTATERIVFKDLTAVWKNVLRGYRIGARQ
jgi:hypothetical protein